jgi:hypothetical protein
VGNGPADEPEVDGGGTLEPDGLDGGHHAAPDRGPVGREHHLLRVLEHVDLLGDRRRRRREVRRGDDLEDEVAGRRDASVQGTERSDRASDRQVDDQVSGYEPPVDPAAGDDRECADGAKSPHRSQAWDPFGWSDGVPM